MDLAAVEALAATASSAVVTAAATDAFEVTKKRIAHLFGRGMANAGVERKYEAIRQRLDGTGAEELEQIQVKLADEWRVRFKDLMDDHPDAAAEIIALVDGLKSVVSSGHVVAADGDISVAADHRGFAAGVVHGDVISNNSRLQTLTIDEYRYRRDAYLISRQLPASSSSPEADLVPAVSR